MKQEIPVTKLQFGMYVTELDRPWEGTPFMFQGFVLTTTKQLDALKKYCKKVYVDPEKASPVEEPAAKTKAPSVLASITEKATYVEKVPVVAEMPAARVATRKAAIVLQDMFTSIQAGKALDAPRVREAVTSMT